MARSLLRADSMNHFENQQGLARSGGTGGQNDRILEEPSATHIVETLHT